MNVGGIDEGHLKVIYSFLSSVERKLSIKILFAVEAGSRYWGFESSQSDYDIRLIYVHHTNWYLSISNEEFKKEIKEVREPDEKCPEIDIVGYELRKTLNLLKQNNPQIIHWLLFSEIRYFYYDPFVEMMKNCTRLCLKTQFHHFFNIGVGNWKAYLRNKKLVNRKKYIYIYRNLLSCLYMIHHHQVSLKEDKSSMDLVFPPMKWNQLFEAVSGQILLESFKGDQEKRDSVVVEMSKILERKRKTVGQWEKQEPIKSLTQGIFDMRTRIQENMKLIYKVEKLEPPSDEVLNKIMFQLVGDFEKLPSCV